jgi:hypothetical protein
MRMNNRLLGLIHSLDPDDLRLEVGHDAGRRQGTTRLTDGSGAAVPVSRAPARHGYERCPAGLPAWRPSPVAGGFVHPVHVRFFDPKDNEMDNGRRSVFALRGASGQLGWDLLRPRRPSCRA